VKKDDLQELLRDALRQLIVEEWDLAVVDAHERTITSHLSRMIGDSGWADWMRVDHDYGRLGSSPKRVQLAAQSDDDEKLVIPDILIHHRGFDSNNLLVLEAKKAQRNDPADELKIRALLQNPYRYRFGVLLNLDIKSNGDQSSWEPEWCWMSDAGDPIEYQIVFSPNIATHLNDEGKQLWHLRL
jgi:hypothetical protein